jgi:hypothetical protein
VCVFISVTWTAEPRYLAERGMNSSPGTARELTMLIPAPGFPGGRRLASGHRMKRCPVKSAGVNLAGGARAQDMAEGSALTQGQPAPGAPGPAQAGKTAARRADNAHGMKTAPQAAMTVRLAKGRAPFSGRGLTARGQGASPLTPAGGKPPAPGPGCRAQFPARRGICRHMIQIRVPARPGEQPLAVLVPGAVKR